MSTLFAPRRARPSALLSTALASAALCVAGGLSCARCAPEKPRAHVAGVAVNDASLDGVVLDVDVIVANHNAVDLFADELHAVATVEKRRAATVDLKQRVTLPAGKETHVHVPVRVRYADVKAVVDAGKGADTWSYVVDGTVVVAPTKEVALRLPFQKDGTIAAPRLPVVSAKNPRVARLSTSELVVAVDVVIDNDNAFAIAKGALSGSVKIGGASTVVDVDVPATPARGATVVKLEQAFPLARLGRAAVDVAAGRAVDVDVDVRAAFGTTVRPLRAELKVKR